MRLTLAAVPAAGEGAIAFSPVHPIPIAAAEDLSRLHHLLNPNRPATSAYTRRTFLEPLRCIHTFRFNGTSATPWRRRRISRQSRKAAVLVFFLTFKMLVTRYRLGQVRLNQYPGTSSLLFDLGSNGTCAEASAIQNLAGLYSSFWNTSYRYSLPYNSNSFTYSLLTYSGTPIPSSVNSYLTIPPRAPGWGLLIPGLAP